MNQIQAFYHDPRNKMNYSDHLEMYNNLMKMGAPLFKDLGMKNSTIRDNIESSDSLHKLIQQKRKSSLFLNSAKRNILSRKKGRGKRKKYCSFSR